MKHALIVLGGASRSGKSTLAAKLGALLNYHVLGLDAIYDALTPVIAGWLPATDSLAENIMRSTALAVIDDIAKRDASWIVEGGWIEPIDAATLAEKYPERSVIVVYLGFPALEMAFALKHMKMHRSYRDWIWPKSTATRKRFFEQQIAGSRWYREQCELLGLKFVDTSVDRNTVLRRAAEKIACQRAHRG